MKNSQYTRILFFVLGGKGQTQGNFPLYCRLTLSKQQKRFATGIRLPINLWLQDKQRAKGSSPIAVSANSKIRDLLNKIQSIEGQFATTQEEYTVDDIINKLYNRATSPFRTLLQAYQYKHKQMVDLNGKGYTASTIAKSIQMEKVIRDFMNEALGANDILFPK